MIMAAKNMDPKVEKFRSDLDELLKERIKDVDDIPRIRDRRIALGTQAQELGLNFRLEIVHAERRKENA